MTGILDAGFIFWGLFLVFGVIVVAYFLWMRWAERRGAPPDGRDAPEERLGTPPDGPNPGAEAP
jgi:hypothetical protein